MAEGPGSLFQNYNPEGALGGLFAPAYIAGYAPSNQAVQAWQQRQRPITSDMIDELRMPAPYQYTSASVYGGQYGSVPSNIRFGDQRGQVDPTILRRAAMGGTYDVQGRRDAIAQRIAENEQGALTAPAFAGYTPGSALTERQWAFPGAIGPLFGASMQEQGLMPKELTYNPEKRIWE